MSSYAQFEEQFTDGGFNINPHWDTLGPYFKVVNQVLNLQGNTAGGKAAILTTNDVGASAEWNLYIRLGFQPSDSENVRIVLSDQFDLRNDFNGYFVQIGKNGTNDGLDFYRKDGSSEVLLKSMISAQFTNGADGNLKVVKNNFGKWIFSWKNFDQPNYLALDSTQDITYNSSAYFGMLCNYTFATKDSFWFDDVNGIRLPLLFNDTIPPKAIQSFVINSKQIDVYFDEVVDEVSSQITTSYFLSPLIGNPFSATIDAVNKKLVHLFFTNKFASETNYTLTVNSIKDTAGNIMLLQNVLLLTTPYYAVTGDVLVNEIMIKPPTATSLPNKQYVELKNMTAEEIRLNNWSVNGKTLLDGYLPPNGFIILCSDDDTTAFKLIGNTVGVEDWNALTNDGVIIIKTDDGITIDSLTYLDNFYQDAVKQSGGWSMELNDIGYSGICPKEIFWSASINTNQGTPGIANQTVTQLINFNAADSLVSRNIIQISFANHPMDKTEVENIANYSIDNGIRILSATALNAYATKVNITLGSNLDSNIIYHFTVKNINGCIRYNHVLTVFDIALTAIPKNGELVLNEILFYPNTNGVQFAELYNTTTSKIFKLKDIVITQADIVSGFDNVILKLDTIRGFVFPNNYSVLSKNKNTLSVQYSNTIITNCTDVNLPEFDKDEDVIVLKGSDNSEVDRLHYNNNWHFPLLVAENNTQGISLERTAYNVATQNKRNWHSATKDTNATPGYRNSDDDYELLDGVHIIPEVFSPDGDGIDDEAKITFSFADDGSVVNTYLYTTDGKLANHLVRDITIPKEGVFVWNGDDENGNKKEIGIYFLVFERKTPEGKKIIYKRKCVLAARLN